MQRIDEHKAGALLPGNLGEVPEIGEVADPPGPGGPHGVQLGRQSPGAAFLEQGRGPEPAGRNYQRTLRRRARGVGSQGVPAETEAAGYGERGTSREDAVDVDRLVPVLPLGGLIAAAVLGVDPDADFASVRDVDLDAGLLSLPHYKDRGQDAPPGCQPGLGQGALLLLGPVGGDPEGRQHVLQGPGGHGTLHSVPAPVAGVDAIGCGEFAQERVGRISVPGLPGTFGGRGVAGVCRMIGVWTVGVWAALGRCGGLGVRLVHHAPTLDAAPTARALSVDVGVIYQFVESLAGSRRGRLLRPV